MRRQQFKRGLNTARIDVFSLLGHQVDVQYPKAEKIVLVMDNLATHSPAALYHTFPPAEARRLVKELERDAICIEHNDLAYP